MFFVFHRLMTTAHLGNYALRSLHFDPVDLRKVHARDALPLADFQRCLL
jgi:hypothetical protein